MRRLAFASFCFAAFAFIAPAQDAAKPKYPDTKRTDHIDELHGVKVDDPYRWLEADVRTSKEVADWVAEQNKVSSAYLAAIPQRESINRRLTELWNYEKFSSPQKVAGRYYIFGRNDGLQNQNVMYSADSLDAEPQ